MKPTSEEYELIELLREWSADRDRLQFAASSEDGVWECELRFINPDGVVACRGVGNSFVEAFNRLDGNDVEPVEDDGPF